MGREILGFREGETIPEGAKYLSSKEVLDYANARHEWVPSPGLMGWIPIFNTETLMRRIPIIQVHYYEVETK